MWIRFLSVCWSRWLEGESIREEWEVCASISEIGRKKRKENHVYQGMY